MRFEILVGSYFVDGKEYKRGDVVTTAQNLDEKWINKFRKLHADEDGAKAPEPTPVQSAELEAPAAVKAEAKTPDLGKYAPNQGLSKVGLTAYKKDGLYHIYDAVNLSDGPVNDTAQELKTRADIKKWLHVFLAD